jgi:ribosomal protein S27AE
MRQSHLMPSRKKIDLEKVLASLNVTCPKCGRIIPPHEIKRVSWEEILCPECGNRFDAKKARSQAGGF